MDWQSLLIARKWIFVYRQKFSDEPLTKFHLYLWLVNGVMFESVAENKKYE